MSSVSYNIVIAGQLVDQSGFQQTEDHLQNIITLTNRATDASRRYKSEAPFGLGNFGQMDVPRVADFSAGISSLSRLMFTAQMSTFYMGMLTSSMERNENAVLQIENAQMRYNTAVREHGRNSQEARIALNTLTMAQNTYEQSARQSQMMTVSMGINFVQMGLSALTMIPKLSAATLSVGGLTAAFHGLTAAMRTNPIGLALTAAAIVVPLGLTAAAAMGSSKPPGGANVNVNVNSDDALLQAWTARHRKTEVNVAG